MNVLITFTTIGVDAGPFNLYSNVDGFTTAFESGVTRAQLLAGFPSVNVPTGTTIIKAQSVGVCNNGYDIVVPPTLCFMFLPDDDDNTYLLSQVYNPTSSYVYGAFTGYEESGIVTTSHDLIKLNIDLTIDTSFNVNVGFNEILYSGSSIIQQSDGKIIATGTFTTYQGVSANRIIRLNTDGSRDNTFVIGTGFDNFTQIPAIDDLGRIIVPGLFDNYNGTPCSSIARIMSDGTFDPTFIVGTGFNNTGLSVLANPDNSMIVTGYFTQYKGVACGNGITKLNSVGTVDPSFVVGTGFSPFAPNNANYLARTPGETSFYVSGYFTSYKGVPEPRIIKLDEFGSKDVSFNAGTGFNAEVYNIFPVWGDKLLIEGAFTSYNGTPAESFIVLNADGTIYYTPGAVSYFTPIIIGNNLFAKQSGSCLELLFTHAEVSTTTTTTTAPPSIYYRYTPTALSNCSSCASLFVIGDIINAQPLVTTKWYYDSATHFRYQIQTFVGMSPGPTNVNINPITQQDTCAAVICPTTTTTTTV